MTGPEYAQLIFDTLELVKSEIIEPNSPGSTVVTRYITSQGASDEEWIAHLRNEAGVTDIWLLTCSSLIGRSDDEMQEAPVGTFPKPLTIVADYFYDYNQGLDYTEDAGGATLTTNSEREFLKHVFSVDLALEKKRRCLKSNIVITGWTFRQRLKRFQTATAHWNAGVISFELQDIVL